MWENLVAFQPVPNTAFLAMRFTSLGEAVENTFYYKKSTPWDEADLLLIAAAAADTYASDWTVLQATTCAMDEVYARDLTTEAAAQASDLSQSGTTGDQDDPEPGNVTLAVSRLSGLTGRSARGRIYWNGLYSLAVEGNTFIAGYAGLVVAAIEALDAAVVAAVASTPVIVSRVQAGVVLATAVTYPIVTWAVHDNNVDSQRRRLAGRGS